MAVEKETLYLSFDVEADGPDPSHNNMLSLGIYGFTKDKTEVFTWQRNFYPRPGKASDPECMINFWSKNQKAWKFVNTNREDPIKAFIDLATELTKLVSFHGYQLEWIGFPAAYDWQWLNVYYQDMLMVYPQYEFIKLGYKATCTSSLWTYWAKFNHLTKDQESALWKECSEGLISDHTPLVDAKCQGIIFYNLMKKMNLF
uniref:Uncharacterized protein n=1 Tax=viral metagenome TaxID=1070528 RepID=A0A6C0E7W5_9ZZZZ